MTADAVLPPEITSTLIHTGPGPQPLAAAAVAWTRLGVDLETAADHCHAITDGVAWRGPSADAMRAAADRYIAWLRATAEQVYEYGAAASAAAAAAGTVRATVTTPAEVAANRTQLMVLIATNLFGQNAAAIAATEAQYQAMWARNTAAMLTYGAASQQAVSSLNPLLPPPVITAAQTAPPSVDVLGASATTAAGFLGGELSGFPITLLQVFAQLATAQGTQATATNLGDIGAGLSAGFGSLGNLGAGLGGGGFGALSMSAISPVTSVLGKGVPVGGLTAPPAATANLRLVSTATPLPTAPDFAGPIIAPPMLNTRKPGSQPPKWRTGKELSGPVMPRPPQGG